MENVGLLMKLPAAAATRRTVLLMTVLLQVDCGHDD